MSDHDRQAVQEVLNRYAAAVNAGDLEAWLALWDAAGIQMPDAAPTRVGLAEIRAGMEPAFQHMVPQIEITSIDEVQVMGDFALTRCNYSLRLTPKAGGDTIEAMPSGKALTVYTKQDDGTWKIAYDCFNSNVEPA